MYRSPRCIFRAEQQTREPLDGDDLEKQAPVLLGDVTEPAFGVVAEVEVVGGREGFELGEVFGVVEVGVRGLGVGWGVGGATGSRAVVEADGAVVHGGELVIGIEWVDVGGWREESVDGLWEEKEVTMRDLRLKWLCLGSGGRGWELPRRTGARRSLYGKHASINKGNGMNKLPDIDLRISRMVNSIVIVISL